MKTLLARRRWRLKRSRRQLRTATFIPTTASPELTARLAEIHEVDPAQILVTAGSTTLLDILARTLLGPGLNAVTSKLSFIVYPIVTQAAGARLIEVPTLNDGYDLEGILAAVDANTRVVYLANPNNPTGTVVEADAIDRFLDRLPSHVITVLDEAYYDFASYFAARARAGLLARAGLRAGGTAGHRAANVLQSARAGWTSRRLRHGAGGADGISGAHEAGVHGVVAGRGGGAGRAGRCRPLAASGGE